jgi:hypothetical protein
MDAQQAGTAGVTALLVLVAGGLFKFCQSRPTLRSNCCGRQVAVTMSAERTPQQGQAAQPRSGSSFMDPVVVTTARVAPGPGPVATGPVDHVAVAIQPASARTGHDEKEDS